MRTLIFIIVFLIFSCKPSEVEVYIEDIPEQLLSNENRYDLDNVIYPVDKKFVYNFKFLVDKKEVDTELKKIIMTIKGTTKPFSNFNSDYSQTVIQYEYFDADNKRMHKERTGLVENSKNIWVHPPRMDFAGILQLSAFPFIRFDKKQWIWKLDAAYENYQDVQLIHNYKKLKPVIYNTEFGELKCIPIDVSTRSHIGETSSNFLFNEKFGFVRFEFHNIDNSSVILSLKQ